MSKLIETDALIIGAGPVGLFAVFELGLLNINCHVIDILDKPGGQCAQLYPEKPIYDIPAYPMISGKDLTDKLLLQIKPFSPVFHFEELAKDLKKNNDGTWHISTKKGLNFHAKVIIIAAGGGSFEPKKPNIPNLEKYFDQVRYSIDQIDNFKNKDIVILGGGDSALDWTVQLNEIVKSLTLIHRRDVFRGSPATVNKVMDLRDKGEIKFHVGQVKNIIGSNGILDAVQCEKKEGILEIPCDILMPFFGLTMSLGPVEKWGLNLLEDRVSVSTETYQTSVPGIYAVGDINTYPGKLKLILSGFHETALMAHAVFKYINPEERLTLQYTTTSSSLQKKLLAK
ncbi:MAG: NAD(P)/FAD-dependent oxidoreductase [Hyphomicrobiales bacterium]|nr:NAD(P)/FAD-dependent oxidoreductase [Hyphomicrobiales bacterium]